MNSQIADEKIKELEKRIEMLEVQSCYNAIRVTTLENKIKDLSERVESIEKWMKEDREERLSKLKAELDYAKFRCALPTIMDMMSHD